VNDLAAVHTILKRLNESGELRFIARGPGAQQYVWNRPVTPVALGPDILRFMRENAHEHEAMHATEEDIPPRSKTGRAPRRPPRAKRSR
jgi:hypothetical protein